MQSKATPTRFLCVRALALCAAGGGLFLSVGSLAAKGPPSGGGGSTGGGSTAPQYVVTDLGSFTNQGFPVVRSMNNVGGVIAQHDGSENSGPAALLQLDTTGAIQEVLDLFGPDDPAQTTSANDLNDDFEIAGSASRPFVLNPNRILPLTQAILWRVPVSGPVQLLELDGFPVADGNQHSSTAVAISANGLIAGVDSELDTVNEVNVRRDVVVWQTDASGVVSLIALPAGGEVTSINSAGIVTGTTDADVPAYWVLEADEQGLLVGASNPIPLPGLGGAAIIANRITEGGRIAGSAYTADGQRHAVVWSVDATGALTNTSDLGIVSRYEYATAVSANDLGKTVGDSWRNAKGNSIGQEWTPFYDDGSQITDLNKLVVDMAGLKRLVHAEKINKHGWICGVADSGTQLHGYVAIPVP